MCMYNMCMLSEDIFTKLESIFFELMSSHIGTKWQWSGAHFRPL